VLRQYFYLDLERLASYAGQLGSRKIREKIAKWTVQFGVTPVSGTQDEVLRDPTVHEEVERLLAEGPKDGTLTPGRVAGRKAFNGRQKGLRLETCRASNVFLPHAEPESLVRKDDFLNPEILGHEPLRQVGFQQWSTNEALKRAAERRWRQKVEEVRAELASFKGVSLWWSDSAGVPGEGELFLVTGSKHHVNAEGFAPSSAYTALTALFFEIGPELRRTALHTIGDRDLSASYPSALQDRYLADPLEWFRAFGARVGPARTITTLYELRDMVLYRDRHGEEAIATIGYPIFIAAGAA
jgi:hypothetical protein